MCLKLVLDMNLPPIFAEYLNRYGIHAEHWHEIGRADASDREIMQYASENGYVVVTLDLDFGAVLAATQEVSPSVVQIRAKEAITEKIFSIVLAAIISAKQALLDGAILTIDTEHSRIRMLPIL